MQALTAPSKNQRRKFCFMHGLIGLTNNIKNKTKQLLITLICWTTYFSPTVDSFLCYQTWEVMSRLTRDSTDSKDKDVRARINSVPLVRIWSTIKKHFSIDTRQPWCQASCVWKINSVHMLSSCGIRMRELVPQRNYSWIAAPIPRSLCENNGPNKCIPRTWIHYNNASKNLEKELGLDSMNNYIARRQLRWLGFWACKRCVFLSSSQAHAILMAPLPKMQRCLGTVDPLGITRLTPLDTTWCTASALSSLRDFSVGVYKPLCACLYAFADHWLCDFILETQSVLCLSIRYKTISDGLGDYDTRRYTTCRWTHSHWLNDRRPCTRNGTCPWMYTPNQQLKNSKMSLRRY